MNPTKYNGELESTSNRRKRPENESQSLRLTLAHLNRCASMDAFTSKVQGVVDRLTTPEAMPFTIAGGVIVGAIASVGVWRAATAAYEGNLTELQRKLSKGVAQTASGKLLTITRASPSTTAGCATMIAAALVEEDDASLKAMCPEVSVRATAGSGALCKA